MSQVVYVRCLRCAVPTPCADLDGECCRRCSAALVALIERVTGRPARCRSRFPSKCGRARVRAGEAGDQEPDRDPGREERIREYQRRAERRETVARRDRAA